MKITINRRIPTINLLYWHKGNIKILKTEARELRSYIQEQVDEQIDYLDLTDYRDKKLKVIIDVYENWFTKKGLVKKLDISNREKFFTDSVFMALGLDDKFIFKHEMNKIQSETNKSIINIEEI